MEAHHVIRETVLELQFPHVFLVTKPVPATNPTTRLRLRPQGAWFSFSLFLSTVFSRGWFELFFCICDAICIPDVQRMLFVKSKELLLRGEGGLARAAGGCSAPWVRMSLSNYAGRRSGHDVMGALVIWADHRRIRARSCIWEVLRSIRLRLAFSCFKFKFGNCSTKMYCVCPEQARHRAFRH